MIEKKVLTGLFALCAVFTIGTTAQEVKPIVIQVDRPAAEIRPTMWGVFFEDINFAADGGLYASVEREIILKEKRLRCPFRLILFRLSGSNLNSHGTLTK